MQGEFFFGGGFNLNDSCMVGEVASQYMIIFFPGGGFHLYCNTCMIGDIASQYMVMRSSDLIYVIYSFIVVLLMDNSPNCLVL